MTETLPPVVDAPATPQPGRESSNSELDALFAVDDANAEPPTREEFNAMKKGVHKFFSEHGMKPKPVEVVPPVVAPVVTPGEQPKPATISPVLKSLYFDKHPEAETVWPTVIAEAEKLGKDPFELFESSVFLKGEAKALYDKKLADENAKSNISAPSSVVKGGKFTFDKIDMGNPDHIKWLNDKPERREEYNEWLKANWKP